MGDLVFICVLLVYLRQQIVGPSAKRVTTNHERSTIGRAERGSWRPLRPCNGGTREARRRGHFSKNIQEKFRKSVEEYFQEIR